MNAEAYATPRASCDEINHISPARFCTSIVHGAIKHDSGRLHCPASVSASQLQPGPIIPTRGGLAWNCFLSFAQSKNETRSQVKHIFYNLQWNPPVQLKPLHIPAHSAPPTTSKCCSISPHPYQSCAQKRKRSNHRPRCEPLG